MTWPPAPCDVISCNHSTRFSSLLCQMCLRDMRIATETATIVNNLRWKNYRSLSKNHRKLSIIFCFLNINIFLAKTQAASSAKDMISSTVWYVAVLRTSNSQGKTIRPIVPRKGKRHHCFNCHVAIVILAHKQHFTL